jgi:hypothetical protein
MTMLAKYKIDYSIQFRRHTQSQHYLTNDPVACEEFLVELLDRGFRIDGTSHEGAELPQNEFDRMVKTAAGMLITRHICASLGLDSVEAHKRFGSPAYRWALAFERPYRHVLSIEKSKAREMERISITIEKPKAINFVDKGDIDENKSGSVD